MQHDNNKNLENKKSTDLPIDVENKLKELIEKIDTIESLVNKFESKSLKEVTKQLNEIDSAKLNWVNLFAINSLFFSYLKCSGKATKDHPIMNELNRIRNYMLRINEISKKEEEKLQKTTKLIIDKDSSARILKRSLWQYSHKSSSSSSNNNNNNEDEFQIKRLKTD